MYSPYVVGITGGSASGKTLFLKELLRYFKTEEICLLSQDNYYKPIGLQPKDKNGIENFDTPESIDAEAYSSDLKSLKEGKQVSRLEYTYNNRNKKASQLIFNPAPIIVVEGIFVLYFQHLSGLIDLKVFIDAKEHIKLKRRIHRDRQERGYEVEDVLYRYEHHISPTYEKYIEPFKYDADIVIPNNFGFNTALEVLVSFLKSKLPL